MLVGLGMMFWLSFLLLGGGATLFPVVIGLRRRTQLRICLLPNWVVFWIFIGPVPQNEPWRAPVVDFRLCHSAYSAS